MTVPSWGTPQPADDDGSGAFVVVVEQTGGGSDDRRWLADPPMPAPAGREQARAGARRLALETKPHHPWNETARQVVQLDEDSYLVVVQGATRTFHYRVSVGRLIA